MSATSGLKLEACSLLPDEGAKARFMQGFSAAPGEIRRDPYRVGLLPPEAWAAFMSMPMPFAREFWLVRGEGERILGRIGASVSPVHKTYGYLGFFEVALDHRGAGAVAGELLRAAAAWLKARGATDAFGPLTFNTWFPYRFRVFDGTHDASPLFSWEPVNPPGYAKAWTDFGFSVAETYHSQGLSGLREFADMTLGAYEAALAKGYAFRPFNAERVLEDEVPLLHKFSMEGFKKNFLFEPIPLEAFRRLYVPLAKKANLTLANFVVDPAGAEQGYFFCFPDRDYMIMKTVTVSAAARGLGLSNAMAHLHAVNALKQGCDKFVTALVRSGAQSESYGRKTELLWKHEYVLYKRPLL